MYVEFMSSLPGQKKTLAKLCISFPGCFVGRGDHGQVRALVWGLGGLSIDKWGFRPPFLVCKDSDWWRVGCALARSQLCKTRAGGKGVNPAQSPGRVVVPGTAYAICRHHWAKHVNGGGVKMPECWRAQARRIMCCHVAFLWGWLTKEQHCADRDVLF